MRKLANEELDRLTVEEFKAADKVPFVLVLDNVRSLNNVGSAFRTADAFLLEGICLCGITAQPPHREIRKTALGATETVGWNYFEKTEQAVASLKEQGYKIIAIEQADQSIMLDKFELDLSEEKWALVFGHEVHGVGEEVVQMADICLEIPQGGTKHSLNIAVSVGVVVWDLWCKRKALLKE